MSTAVFPLSVALHANPDKPSLDHLVSKYKHCASDLMRTVIENMELFEQSFEERMAFLESLMERLNIVPISASDYDAWHSDLVQLDEHLLLFKSQLERFLDTWSLPPMRFRRMVGQHAVFVEYDHV